MCKGKREISLLNAAVHLVALKGGPVIGLAGCSSLLLINAMGQKEIGGMQVIYR